MTHSVCEPVQFAVAGRPLGGARSKLRVTMSGAKGAGKETDMEEVERSEGGRRRKVCGRERVSGGLREEEGPGSTQGGREVGSVGGMGG